MERISKALDKALANQTTFNVGDLQPLNQGSVRAPRIQYSRTQSVGVSRELLRQNRIISGMEPGPFVDAYKILRTRVIQKLREHNWNALAITSPGVNAGKTLTAINLALSLALEVNQTVLLVDANLRNPSVHKYFGIEPTHGLSDFLLDHVSIEDMLINPKGIDRFVILPGKRPLPDSSEMLSSPRMIELVEEVKSRYPSRIVLFDLPHLGTSDALAFAPYVDAALLVLEEGKTTQDELQQAIEHLQPKPIIGTVLNKAEAGSAGEL
ncbi:CpsD/CapB family tyrosine-protein kinase [Methylococcus sp. EFPC2]|uniref:CpsD/CapB family tyrosine-protein kinase n=1 Tax=Methylococcus sp. EFPC2 TaxID=2812648 RepID=UPI00196872EF|nr:CpsD/CapB family tyrosine-protein kinase [Methylococcus sp. EFPC2]QSA97587.1 CpsD/CapB family tyrosine-protein kinase [Methylococcus sp. EFPC2]